MDRRQLTSRGDLLGGIIVALALVTQTLVPFPCAPSNIVDLSETLYHRARRYQILNVVFSRPKREVSRPSKSRGLSEQATCRLWVNKRGSAVPSLIVTLWLLLAWPASSLSIIRAEKQAPAKPDTDIDGASPYSTSDMNPSAGHLYDTALSASGLTRSYQIFTSHLLQTTAQPIQPLTGDTPPTALTLWSNANSMRIRSFTLSPPRTHTHPQARMYKHSSEDRR